MWEGDLGWLPVVDDAQRVVGVITDRDVCMAALMSGAPLWALAVGATMSKVVFSAKPGDKLRAAVRTMTENQVRRLPVVDGDGLLVGLVTLGSLAQAAAKKSMLSAKDVNGILASVTSPRPAPVSARLEIEVRRDQLPSELLQPAPRRSAKGATTAKRETEKRETTAPKAKAKVKATK
jgi:predicted transcriptional regulator